jgi:hypothetical protein
VGPSEFPDQPGETMNLGNDVTSKDTNAARKMHVLEGRLEFREQVGNASVRGVSDEVTFSQLTKR